MQKYYKLVYKDGTAQVVTAKSDLELVRKYDLASKANIDTQIIQFEHDSLAASVAALELVA